MGVGQNESHQCLHPCVGIDTALVLDIHQHGEIEIKAGFLLSHLHHIRELFSVKPENRHQEHIIVKGLELGDGHQQIVSLVGQLERP